MFVTKLIDVYNLFFNKVASICWFIISFNGWTIRNIKNNNGFRKFEKYDDSLNINANKDSQDWNLYYN